MASRTENALNEIHTIITDQQLKLWQLMDTEMSIKQKLLEIEIKIDTSDLLAHQKLFETDADGINAKQLFDVIQNSICEHDFLIYQLIESKIEAQQQINRWKQNKKLVRPKVESPEFHITDMNYSLDADTALNDDQSRTTSPAYRATCNKCPEKFKTKKQFRFHLQKVHRVYYQFFCGDCSEYFRSPLMLQDHRNTHTGATPYRCDICRARFATQALVRNHMIEHSKLDSQSPATHPYLCQVCGMRFQLSSLMKVHRKVHQQFACCECDKTFRSQATLTAHMKEHKVGAIFVCDQCDKKYHTASLLKRHQQSHLDQTNTCKICDKTFRDVTTFKRHVKSHANAEKFDYHCSICNKTYASNTSLSNHMIRHHYGTMEFSCSECGKLFLIERELREHKKAVHTEERKFTCGNCNTKFKTKMAMRHHVKIHLKERPKFPCETCQKTFSTQGNLKIHTRIHTGERPHVCEVCGKSFIHSTYMKVHMRLHTGEKPLGCSYCDRRFSDPRNQRKHMKIHLAKMELAEN